MSIRLIFIKLFLFSCFFYGQGEDLFKNLRLDSEKNLDLLPQNMIFTQRLLWGNKGLFRKIGISPLNEEQRESELKLRRKMLKLHQVIGFLTLAGMVTQGVLGTQLYNGKGYLYRKHKKIGNLTSLSYFTGASLSLFSPPPLITRKDKGFSSVKAHKYLASIHFSSMLATNILSKRNRNLHRVAALSAFGSYAAAILVFKF